MVFATWLSYLVPDLYQQLCMAAMCPLEDPDFSDLDNYESMRAVAESSTYDSSKKSNFPRTSTSASAAAFELRAGSIPLKFARGMQGLCLAQENNTSNDQSLMNSMIVDKDHPFYQDLTVKNVLPKGTVFLCVPFAELIVHFLQYVSR